MYSSSVKLLMAYPIVICLLTDIILIRTCTVLYEYSTVLRTIQSLEIPKISGKTSKLCNYCDTIRQQSRNSQAYKIIIENRK